MPVDFSSLASTVARAGANDNLHLSGGGDQGEAIGEKSFYSRRAGTSTPTPEEAAQNKSIRNAVWECLSSTYGQDRHLNKTDLNDLRHRLELSSDKPLSARTVSEVIDKLHVYRAGPYVDWNRQGDATKLGSGQVNTVHLGKWSDRTVTQTMVFKAEHNPRTRLQPDAEQIGIPADHPNLAARNVATYQLSLALGLDVIPKTHFAVNEMRAGSVMALAPGISAPGGKSLRVYTGAPPEGVREHRAELERILGQRNLCIKEVGRDGSLTLHVPPDSIRGRKNELIESFRDARNLPQLDEAGMRRFAANAPDDSGAEIIIENLDRLETTIVSIDASDTQLRKGMNQLQWLDSLCGQADRHPGNIFIERGPDGRVSGVKGIDNDMSFGVNSDTAYANSKNPGQQPRGVNTQGKYPAVPSVIDAALRKKLVDMEAKPADAPGSIESVLKGKLSPAEIAQTRERLTQLVARLGPDDVPPNTAPEVHRVNNDAGWGSDEVTQLLDASGRQSPNGACGSYLSACKEAQSGLPQIDMVELQAEIKTLMSQSQGADAAAPWAYAARSRR